MFVGSSNGDIKIFACNSNPQLANDIVTHLSKLSEKTSKENAQKFGTVQVNKDIRLNDSDVGYFKDGEISLKINESVRECDVFVIQSTSYPVNDNLMELLIMIDALRRASAKRITAIIPYYGYSRQDRKDRARDPISAKLVANLLTIAGADRILTMDLHCAQIQGFFDIPLDHLRGLPIFYEYYKEKFKDNIEEVIIASPDLGSVGRARNLAELLNVSISIVDKRRHKEDESEVLNIIGDIKGKIAILTDDEIDTAGSITNAAQALIESGAKEVYACATHGKFSGEAIERIKNSHIKEMVILDTILQKPEKSLPNIKTLSAGKYFAEAIFRVHEGLPVSELF
ncbi:MAG: ribose-phosphate pyrophosphokinase [Defluviitaleaceae bacterium]|nr:ribose-phosphate pyrophosphokinase [Defluviitaleaceae bacterium]